MRHRHLFLILPLLVAVCVSALPAQPRYLMRSPDISGDRVVFAYGEDIWMVPAAGGVATRLTFDPGEENNPKFSPDGSTIAFTGEYDGNTDVYVMGAHGGGITRVTFHPGRDRVVGWHPTKNKILFASARQNGTRSAQLFLISPDGTGLEPLILHEASFGSYSSDANRIAYTRTGGEERTWKRYRGGQAQDVYMFEFDRLQDSRLTTFDGGDHTPLWVGESIVFCSDRGGTYNLYAFDTRTAAVTQLTNHRGYDVRRPSDGGSRIVYELGGSLRVYDLASSTDTEISVEIRTDLPDLRPYWRGVEGDITGIDITPSGNRALVVARGDVFSVPKENGAVVNLTGSPGSREKDAVWSPDGKSVAYFSDGSGEYELYVAGRSGSGAPFRLTTHTSGYRHTLRWSPDSKKLAYADQTLRCYIIDVATKKITEVDRALFEDVDVSLDLKPISDYAWSPDSRFLAYSKMDSNLVSGVWVYFLETGTKVMVSNGIFNDFGPEFAPDGEHLLFVSNRLFDPTFCDFEWEMVYKKVAGIFAVTLRKNGPPLLGLRSDDDTPAPPAGKGPGTEAPVRVRIDPDGIAGRIEALPLARGNYRSLSVTKSAVYFLNADEGDFNRFEFRAIGPRTLFAFDFESRKERTIIRDIDMYRLSADGTSLVYKKGKTVGILSAKEKDSRGEPIALNDLKVLMNPLAEWKQIFNETWRMQRDFFYDPNMHGISWEAMKAKYSPLMDAVSCRADVGYVLGELIGELGTSHTYVIGGDSRRKTETVTVGMLGVDWEVDAAAARFRFTKIYDVPDWTGEVAPPLAAVGVDVRPGDYLLRVNGTDVKTDRNFYSYFQNLGKKQVRLTVNSTPSMTGAREVTVKTVTGETELRYQDWVERNRRLVDSLSGGQIGYLHLPDTYTRSAVEFPKYFYAQTRKKGLIVDGRFNGGGLDPDIFLQRLDKNPQSYWTRRYSHDQTSPPVSTRAHMVCLTNRQAGSGGDSLPWEFQQLGMGPVIGTRTWGGLVGVSMFISLIDGGQITVPDYRIYSPSGKWVVENEGVQPDIEIDLDPVQMARGYDAQLMTGMNVLKEKITSDPRPWPTHPPFPTVRK